MVWMTEVVGGQRWECCGGGGDGGVEVGRWRGLGVGVLERRGCWVGVYTVCSRARQCWVLCIAGTH